MTLVALLASGGLDSTTVAYQLATQGMEIYPIFFDYGQHCVEKEWARVNQLLSWNVRQPERTSIKDVFRGSRSRLIVEANLWTEPVHKDDLYVPYRTFMFFAAGAARAQTLGITQVYTGFINSNHAMEIDCTSDFLNSLDGLNQQVGPVRFISPFRYSSKREVAEVAIKLGVPIGLTFSCQAASKFPCGACPNCVERITALQEAGLL
jgi:7-cyano-7-deazaguanine synthase